MDWKSLETQLYTMVMIEKDEKVLLVKRPDHKGFLGYIALGGKIDFPESPSEGAIREVKEETGLDVNNLTFKGIDEFVNLENRLRYVVYNYLATDVSGNLLEYPPEGELVWTNKETAVELQMQPWFKRRFPYFFKDGTFEIHSKWDGNGKNSAKITITEL